MIPQSAITFAQPSEWVARHLLPDFSLISFPPQSQVLDIGCGFGRRLQPMREAGIRAEGIDPDPEALSWCHGLGLPAQQASAEHLPFADASFDGAVCDGVLQFTDPSAALREAARVLKPGAQFHLCTQGCGYALHLLIAYPGRRKLYAIRTLLGAIYYRMLRTRPPPGLGDTLCFFPRQLSVLAQSAGFEVVRQTEGPRHAGLTVFLYLTLRKAAS